MAYNVTAKSVQTNGSTPGNRVVYNIYDANHTLDSDDFTFSGTYVNARIIESVTNMGQSAVTIDGKDFETGRWELSLHGGIILAEPGKCAVSFATANQGNVIIEFRS